jgi:molybdenum ABC transporter molybdate-binding protein
MQAIAQEFERETGDRIEFAFGDSGAMLGGVSLRPEGDLFLPADDSFVRLAQERGLVAESFTICRMRAVILTRPGNPFHLEAFDDLLKPGLKLGIANPDQAAIGKVVRAHLRQLGKWDALAPHIVAQQITVTDSANAVQLGSLDAAIVWDVVAANYPQLAVVRTPELDGAVGRVALAILSQSPSPQGARRLASYIAASDRGMFQFRKAGFTDLDPGPPWSSAVVHP